MDSTLALMVLVLQFALSYLICELDDGRQNKLSSLDIWQRDNPHPNQRQHSVKPSISQSFPPLIGAEAHTLILGTMPGQASLSAREYYAHPRNALWPIMHAIIDQSAPSFTVHETLNYAERCALLVSHGYALWDVLSSCERPGSLDAKIVRDSEMPNDIASLVKQHPELSCIACNGRTAETLFNRHIKSTLQSYEKVSANEAIATGHGCDQPIKIISLPSTSPAMATLNLDAKHTRWATVLAQH